MTTFEQLHPDIASNPVATKYTRLDSFGKIVEAWVKNDDGIWIETTQDVGQLYLELVLC